MLKTLPNMLTMLRIMFIPIFVIIFYLPFKGAHLLIGLMVI